jgi:hypothetical protein
MIKNRDEPINPSNEVCEEFDDDLAKYVPKFYPTGGLTKLELSAIENHAQLIRYVQRAQITSKEAAELSISHAESLFDELDRRKR